MRQDGYALLLGIFSLLGMSSLWVGGVLLQNSQAGAGEKLSQTLELSKAKLALTHYGVNYIDHYGAQGAGPGHLPCPDTDQPDNSDINPWRLDGPNPPCGREPIEFGWLPRHVTVINGRFHFHTRAKQRLLYAVAENVVNNPVGRAVNPSTITNVKIGSFNNVIAIVAAPSLETDQYSIPSWFKRLDMDAAGVAYTLISAADIKTPMMRRVGDWLLDRFNSALNERCSNVPEVTQCIVAIVTAAQCELVDIEKVLHWMHTGVAPENCEGYGEALKGAFELVDLVPLSRHWFFRNGWHRFVEVNVSEECAATEASTCSFSMSSTDNDIILITLTSVPPN